jgi:GTPase
MARLPLVAIIGRPNAGKSTLFNRLTRSRKAIVSDVAGTTRDHVASRVDDPRMSYLLVDTGGIGDGSEDKDLEGDVSTQSMIALAAADLILFTVSNQDELTASDHKVAEILRKKRKRHVPVILVATKCDKPESFDSRLASYYELGIADSVLGVSAVHGMGIGELEDAIIAALAELRFEPQRTTSADESLGQPRIAVVGKPNVGKSSLVNALMSEPQRQSSPRLVSEIPGTTRDASDTVIKHDGKDYIFVDTAGLRRQAKVEEDIEALSALKSIRALEEADICVLVVSATEPVSKQDKRLARMAVDSGKGLILFVNKADLLTKAQKEEKAAEVASALQFARFAPTLFTSAETRENLLKVFPLIETVARNRSRRIATRDLRRWYDEAVQRVPSTVIGRSKHLTQAEDVPPTFVLFVGKPQAVIGPHLKYLENSMRQTFAFEGTPIRWITKDKNEGGRE